MALRLELTPPPGKPVEVELIAGIGDPAKYIHQPPAGKKWADVVAGDVLSGEREAAVIRVRIFRAIGANDGDEIVSGRDWLETGQVLRQADAGTGCLRPR